MRYAIYSCEGFAREVLPSLRRQAGEGADIVFVDDDTTKIGSTVHGRPVISFEDLCQTEHRDRQVSVAVADARIRRLLVEKCESEGLSFCSIADETHLRFDNVAVGEGSIFCANTMVTGDAKIGRHFHCNIYSYVAHDCEIGDFVTFAPRVSCNGRVEIGDNAYVGTGAILRQGAHDKPLRIGANAIVGMGAIVLKDVVAGEVVVGNPGKVIRKVDG